MFQSDIAVRFEDVIKRLLAGERVDLNAENVSLMFEAIAGNLLSGNPLRTNSYFDGVANLTAIAQSPGKIEFKGDMWVGCNKEQWTEPFLASVVDKRSTDQGFSIKIQIGQDRAEADLSSAFGMRE